MKTKKLKPRRMWANCYPDGKVYVRRTKRLAANCRAAIPGVRTIHVAVIPLDDVEAVVEKAILAFFGHVRTGTNRDRMRHALVAIGVLPKRKGRK